MDNQHKLIAVEGQLNYGFTVPQNTIYVKDTNEIKVCNTELSRVQNLLTVSQNEERKLHTIIDVQSKEIIQLRIYATSLSMLCIATAIFIGLLIYFCYRRHLSPQERS